ncbi:MAG: hypothetical protein F6K22_33230, partial [Okeania sp. SIO2F4]|uniref:hypothetical protein n=1 Tax=Okeania sp. SIO2F4 TaxID=2607790 RepID=UPI00142958DE
MARRRRGREKAEEIQEIIEDAADLAYSAQEEGVEKAVDDYIGEKIRDATQKAAMRRLGNHPALILLPEFIEAQKGYGPAIYEDTSTDLRRELGSESEDPTLEDVEQLFEDSELLEDIIDEELEEIDDIIEQLDEKDLEKIVEDFEEEIPNEEIETDEHEEDGKKCHSISIGFGDDQITFNTWDQNDNFDDDELNEIDEKSDGDYEIPDIPGSGLWCKEFSITLGVPATSVLK